MSGVMAMDGGSLLKRCEAAPGRCGAYSQPLGKGQNGRTTEKAPRIAPERLLFEPMRDLSCSRARSAITVGGDRCSSTA